ncbi:hypothetical protein ACHAQH_009263 [Verticillium albo-atrum]
MGDKNARSGKGVFGRIKTEPGFRQQKLRGEEEKLQAQQQQEQQQQMLQQQQEQERLRLGAA